MADFLGLMKQAAELKSKMESMQAELDTIEVEGTSGGGMVTVRLSGKGEMKSVKIDDSLIKPSEKEIVEDLIVAAHADHSGVVSGKAVGRTSDEQITWSERGNLQGAQFYAVAGRIYEAAKAAKLGYEIPTSLFLQDIRD